MDGSELHWSNEWVPLLGAGRSAAVPSAPGLYRVRTTHDRVVVYIGQTGVSLRKRLGMLSGIYGDEMPYRDPHTAAPALWALRHRDRCDYETSTCVVEGTVPFRRAAEALAISLHREAHGASPFANFGGMPSGYRKSSANNSGLVARGKRFRGGLDTSAPTVEPSIPPFGPLTGSPVADLWCGLQWSPWTDASRLQLPGGKGLYRFRRPGSESLIYVGQGLVRDRVAQHLKKVGNPEHRQSGLFSHPLEVSFALQREMCTRNQIEIENDLIAAHLVATDEAPAAQFLG